MTTPVPEFRVVRILDHTSLLVGGETVGKLGVGEELLVLSVGPVIAELGARIVVPKAEVRVEVQAGVYVIARTLERDPIREARDPLRARHGGPITDRVPLEVDPADVMGNPASLRVVPGDVLVRRADLPRYITGVT